MRQPLSGTGSSVEAGSSTIFPGVRRTTARMRTTNADQCRTRAAACLSCETSMPPERVLHASLENRYRVRGRRGLNPWRKSRARRGWLDHRLDSADRAECQPARRQRNLRHRRLGGRQLQRSQEHRPRLASAHRPLERHGLEHRAEPLTRHECRPDRRVPSKPCLYRSSPAPPAKAVSASGRPIGWTSNCGPAKTSTSS